MKVDVLNYLNSLLEGTGISKLSIKRSNSKIAISRNPNVQQKKATLKPSGPIKEKQDVPVTKSDNTFTVKSKTVGIFYRGTSKDNAAVVKIKDEIKKGDILGMINCMGVMEKIVSPISGTIKEILAENQKPVEYGNPLFLIEKNNK